MVDINLFKDEGEDDKDWTPGPDDDSGLGDELNDDFGFDEDEGFEEDLDDHLGFGSESESEPDSEEISLDDEEILDDVDEVPDFDESEDDLLEEEYGIGQEKPKKTSPFLWVFLGIVVIGAAVYQFVIEPQQRAKQQAALTEKPDVNKLIAQMRQQRGLPDSSEAAPVQGEQDTTAATTAPAASQQQATQTPAAQPPQSQAASVSLASVYLPQSANVLGNLAKQGQLGTIILNDTQFHVGYVSATPNASKAMAHRIKTLMDVSEVKSAPEERHYTNGRVHYWGVVTGELEERSGSGAGQNRTYASADQFIVWLKSTVQTSRLSVKQTEKFTRQRMGNQMAVPVRIKAEGSRDQIEAFLKKLNQTHGNYSLVKMVIAPVNINDFEARLARVVLDYHLFVE